MSVKIREASKLVSATGDDYLEILRRCGGYYNCFKDGKQIGPLVGYAGKDKKNRQLVGYIYANFAKAEEYPCVLKHYTAKMEPKITPALGLIDAFCGAPIGGYSFSEMLGLYYDRRVIKAEKKVTAVGTKEKREESTLIFGRHGVNPGDQIAIVEDVCNNFDTTDSLLKLIKESGGITIAIICLLNRSLKIDSEYIWQDGKLPVISLVRLPIDQFEEDNPLVADDIAKGNIVRKPKDEWGRLMEAMEQAA